MAKFWEREPSLLLCPNTPKPLHGVTPRTILGSSWWNKERRAAYASTNHRCKACGVPSAKAMFHKWLEGHEWYDIDYMEGTATYIRTVPLCHSCHNYIHDGRMSTLLDLGKIPHAKYAKIIMHGDRVLADAGLSKPSMEQRELEFLHMERAGVVADWSDWRLILNGVEYPPKFSSLSEYLAYWERKNREY